MKLPPVKHGGFGDGLLLGPHYPKFQWFFDLYKHSLLSRKQWQLRLIGDSNLRDDSSGGRWQLG